MPEITIKDVLELAGFAWGIWTWANSKREKKLREQAESFKQLVKRVEMELTERILRTEKTIDSLSDRINELEKQVSGLTATIEGMRDVIRSNSETVVKYGNGIASLMSIWNQKLENFGKVILKE